MKWLCLTLVLLFAYASGLEPATNWDRYAYLWTEGTSLTEITEIADIMPSFETVDGKIYLNPKNIFISPGHIIVEVNERCIEVTILHVDHNGIYVSEDELVQAMIDMGD